VKQFGAMYLILGTCVAAGMLGLPVVTAQGSYLITTLMVFSAWALMTVGAWCLLQVNLWMPAGTNLISMSSQTLGPWVKALTWVVYLMLLYSLICAYLAGSGDILQALLKDIHVMIPRWMATVLMTLVLGGVVFRGIRSVDLVNRVLMSTKLLICVLLIALVIPHVQVSQLAQGDMHWRGYAWLVIICSFGYAIILPSIREYLDGNKKQLARVLFIGSLLPLVLYLVWLSVVQGALARGGVHGLVAMNHSPNTNSMLMYELAKLAHQPLVQSVSVVFISICSITGMLGVSLCLMDFLADGLKMKKQGAARLLLAGLTYLPPMLIVMFDPALFVRALAYAGVCCLYILVALPLAMYGVGRWKKMHQQG
jgi:tyrosine-specific transport protein